MGKTYKRPPIRQHKKLLEDGEFSSRVEKNKKKENKNKHPKRELDYEVITYGTAIQADTEGDLYEMITGQRSTILK